MASIILSSIGSAIGTNFIGGMVGSSIGQLAGSFAGRFIDQNLFGTKESIHSEGRRLTDLKVQSSTWGEMIPVTFGVCHLAGNIIWSTDIKEISHITRQGGGGKGMKIKQTHTSYSYTVSLAIALCEGKISTINKIWADFRTVDMSLKNIRIYNGDEDQLPDPLIESIQGIGKTPAYRGLAYVVFENLALAEFGNRIPNFTFEIKKEPEYYENLEKVEDLIKSVVIIPGCGEFTYDTIPVQKFAADYRNQTWIQKGLKQTLNWNNLSDKTDAVLALEQLKQTLPNVVWVAPVIAWFASSLNISDAEVIPGVEYKGSITTSPEEWKVSKYTRNLARQITMKDEKCIYGGTPSDNSILRCLDEIKLRGYKILFYPMLFIDIASKSWRGHLSGDNENISKFFNQHNGYNEFILHYANLTKGKIDAFIIGSELKGLTSIISPENKFLAVEELIKLAKKVKAIVGEHVKITYAADWSEFHHVHGGWHHLDPLWASTDIDVVGIDAYFPLTQQKRSEYDLEKLMLGWESGEGYDYYYANHTEKQPLLPEWAWKNIKYWWENFHVNPEGNKTEWQPRSKKIWFTEYGFPSITCASNQPNVFYDPSTLESNIPIHSDGNVDFLAQRAAIHATEKKWQDSEMVEQKFLWTWDIRPYPYWPNQLDVWADGQCWLKGHWVQGKLGLSTLAQIITVLIKKTTLSPVDIDTSKLNQTIEGFCISSQSSIKHIIKTLQQAYLFDIIEDNGKLVFLPRKDKKIFEVDKDELAPIHTNKDRVDVINIKMTQEALLPATVNLNFISQHHGFQIGSIHAKRYHTESRESFTLNLPILLTETEAERIAETLLHNAWLERHQYTFTLSLKYIALAPGDVVKIQLNGRDHVIRITNTLFGKNRVIKIEGVAEDISLYGNLHNLNFATTSPTIQNQVSATTFEILDIPLAANEKISALGRILVAACGTASNWKGCSCYFSENNMDYHEIYQVRKAATMGAVLNTLGEASSAAIDDKNKLVVNLINGQLKSITFEECINYGNLAVVGNEVIQFMNAKLLSNFQYELSGFLRGRFGSEHEIPNHHEGDRFVLLDEAIELVEIPNHYLNQKAYCRVVSIGKLLHEGEEVKEIFYYGNALKPYSPCHLTLEKISEREVKLSWIRRTRSGGGLKDFIEVALNEEKEEYLLEFILNDHYRTLTSNKSDIILSGELAEMVNSQNAQIKISQISALVGKGHSTSLVMSRKVI